MAATIPRVLVYGGKGALGSVVVSHFKARNWWVASLDLFANEDAHANVVLSNTESWTQQGGEVEEKVAELLKEDKVDAVVCVAGGWAGGNAAAKNLVQSCDLMWKQSVWTSVMAAQIASKFMNDGGLLVLTGAKAALEGTPGMLGYGLAKAAVHQLIHSLSCPKSGLPSNSTVVGILPITLDTPANRKAMPNADFSQWTPLEFVANQVIDWSEGKERPASSSLVQLITAEGETKMVPVDS